MHYVNGWGNETRSMFQPRALFAAERLTQFAVVRTRPGIMFRHAGTDAPITKAHMVPDLEQRKEYMSMAIQVMNGDYDAQSSGQE